jgi:hypothetical protein
MKKGLTAALLAGTMMLGTAATASAAPQRDVSRPLQANPASVCSVVTQYTGGSFHDCVQGLATGSDEFLQLALQFACPALEEDAMFTGYPYTFYGFLPDDDPQIEAGWPRFRAANRQQCGYAVWAYHNLAPFFFGEEE